MLFQICISFLLMLNTKEDILKNQTVDFCIREINTMKSVGTINCDYQHSSKYHKENSYMRVSKWWPFSFLGELCLWGDDSWPTDTAYPTYPCMYVCKVRCWTAGLFLERDWYWSQHRWWKEHFEQQVSKFQLCLDGECSGIVAWHLSHFL